MRVADLNQDVLKLKKILHKYEEKFGKLERKKHQKDTNSNEESISKSPPVEEEDNYQNNTNVNNPDN